MSCPEQPPPLDAADCPVGHPGDGLLHGPGLEVQTSAAHPEVAWQPAARQVSSAAALLAWGTAYMIPAASQAITPGVCIFPQLAAVVSEVVLILLQQEQREALLAIPGAHDDSQMNEWASEPVQWSPEVKGTLGRCIA
jgi:hypothetical protein